jgi:hypothetical protein
MRWKIARTLALITAPFLALVAALRQVRITGDVHVRFGPTPPPETPVTDVLRQMLEHGADSVTLGKGRIIGGGDDCDCEGGRHEPMIVVPLPDGTCLVSHSNGEGCAWAARVPDRDGIGPAVAHHMEFNCARRSADT